MSENPEQAAEVEQLRDAAETDGPWSPWLDMRSTDRLIAVIDQTEGADMSDHIDRDELEAEIERLAVENARLREKVETLTTGQRGGKWMDPEGDYWRDYWRNRAMKAEEQGRAYRNFRSATETAYALLNPTEGDRE